MATDSSLLIVDIDRTGAFPAEQLAFAVGVDRADVVESMNAALTALAGRKSLPRYVVLDIGVHGDEIIPQITDLSRACAHANAQIVAIGSVNDLSFYRTLKNIGISEYFTHPASVVEVRAALMLKNAGPSHRNVERGPGTVIAFMSAASGDGASTIALNTAYALAQESLAPSVLVDFDYQFGMTARQLDLHAQFGIRELFDYPERGVDATLVSKMLLSYGNGLNLIAAPDILRMMPQVRPEVVRALIHVLKQQFGYVVLDVPHIWSPWTAEALAQADKIVVVAQLWLRSLTHLSRLLSAWHEAGIDRDKIFLSINRSGARFREAITPQDFERVCMKDINLFFANDIKTIVNAENQGKTLLEVGNSLIERQIRDMARGFIGNSAALVPQAPVPASRSGAGKLLSLFNKN